MNDDIRVSVAEDLVAVIKKNPSLSNIIMTSPRFFCFWEQLLLGMFHLEDIDLLPSARDTIIVKGNESKHHPTIALIACQSSDIIGRRVTGVCVLDMHFFKETKSIIDRFDEASKNLKQGDKWFEQNTPLSLYLKCNIVPALSEDAEMWSVGAGRGLQPSVVLEIFSNVTIY